MDFEKINNGIIDADKEQKEQLEKDVHGMEKPETCEPVVIAEETEEEPKEEKPKEREPIINTDEEQSKNEAPREKNELDPESDRDIIA